MKSNKCFIGLCFAVAITFLSCYHSFRLLGGGVVVQKKTPLSWSTSSTTQCHVGTPFLAMTHSNGEAPTSSRVMDQFGSNNTTATATAAAAMTVPRVQQDDSEFVLKRSSTTTPPAYQAPTLQNWAAVVVNNKRVRKHAGVVLATVGFASSATSALWSANNQQQQQQLSSLKPLVDSLVHFLKKSGIDLELSKSLNFRLLDNVIILARIQKMLLQDRDIRDLVAASPVGVVSSVVPPPPSNEEALRYMKYATAAYGDSMIRAANLDVKGDMSFIGMSSGDRSNSNKRTTKTRMSEHINIPEHDIIAMDVDSYGGDSNHLRHFVAVDHVHKKVVLAIRGTFTISELVVDAAGFSRPFCGGEAHSEMANMAERVWQVAGPIVMEVLKKNEGYDLILTGHSLGAGVACLLNILLDFEHRNDHHNNDNGYLNVDGRQVKVQCFAYASPPVFAPKVQQYYENNDSKTSPTNNTPTGPTLELPKAALSCTNYIHEMDVVPFLSVDSIRHFFKCIAVLEEHHPHKWWSLPSWLKPTTSRRARDFYRDAALLDAVQRARTERLRTKPGAPLLAIPAATNVWIMKHRPQPQQQQPLDSASSGSNNNPRDIGAYYDQKLCDPIRLGTLGIHLDLRMLQDHFPSRYEHALHHLL